MKIRSYSPVSLKNRQKEKTEMKTKTMTALLLLIALALFATPASARFLDDDWFIEKAITNVETDHVDDLEDLDIAWNGVVTSGFEMQFRPYVSLHKLASIVGSFSSTSIFLTLNLYIFIFYHLYLFNPLSTFDIFIYLSLCKIHISKYLSH